MSSTAKAAKAAKKVPDVDDDGVYLPENSAFEVLIAATIALFAVLWVQPLFPYTGLGNDEGIALQGAVRILAGQLPYRDFFSFYTPGCYYLYAALFKVFGTSIEVARIVLVGYAALFSFLTYLLARRLHSRSAAAFAAVLVALICLPVRFQSLHNWDSTATALISLYLAILFIETKKTVWIFLAGIFAGATLMINQSKGAGLSLGFAVAVLALSRMEPKCFKPRDLWMATAGASGPVLLVFAYFGSQSALLPMLNGWLWPFLHYTEVNRLPFGYIFWSPAVPMLWSSSTGFERAIVAVLMSGMVLLSTMPVLLVGGTCYIAARAWIGRVEPTPVLRQVVLTGSVVAAMLAATWSTGRADFLRLVFIAPLFMFAIPLLLDARVVPLPALLRLRPLIAVYLLLAFTGCGLLFRSVAVNSPTVWVSTPRGAIRTAAPEEVLPYLETQVKEGERVLIYPYAATYSFLSGTLSPTRFDFLQVGMHPAEDFEIARRELERDRTRVVLFDITFREKAAQVWPSTPADVLARDPMGDFIFSHYRACKVLQGSRRPFAFMVRNDLRCPPSS